MAEAWFDEEVIPGGKNLDGDKLPDKTIVFFHLRKKAITQPSIDFEFDGPATAQHKASYESAWLKFQASKAAKESVEGEMIDAGTPIPNTPVFDDEA